MKQYWVIGGEFRDTSFRELVTTMPEAAGPFEGYEQALSEWRRKTEATRRHATVRYTIAATAVAG
jgi:Domain of unknown function (DUF4170)